MGGEETEEARAAVELCTTVSQHTGRYKCFSCSLYLSGKTHKQNFVICELIQLLVVILYLHIGKLKVNEVHSPSLMNKTKIIPVTNTSNIANNMQQQRLKDKHGRAEISWICNHSSRRVILLSSKLLNRILTKLKGCLFCRLNLKTIKI